MPTETILVIETNVDDLSPEIAGYVQEQALALGALDVYLTPVQMKKNRPGLQLTLLARPEQRDLLVALLLRETTSLGVRISAAERIVAERRHELVETAYGPIRIKVAGESGSAAANAAPEYEDCRTAALRHQVPLKAVYQEALRAWADRPA